MTDAFRDRRVQAALFALVISAILAGAAFRRAVRLEPLPPSRAAAGGDSIVPVPPRSPYPPEYLVEAVRSDPFSPGRTPHTAFVLPGEAAAPSVPQGETVPDPYAAAPSSPMVRLVGTMVMPGGRAVALLEDAGAPARIVRVGERIGSRTLSHVEPGRAVLVSAGGERLELRVSRPGT